MQKKKKCPNERAKFVRSLTEVIAEVTSTVIHKRNKHCNVIGTMWLYKMQRMCKVHSHVPVYFVYGCTSSRSVLLHFGTIE